MLGHGGQVVQRRYEDEGTARFGPLDPPDDIPIDRRFNVRKPCFAHQLGNLCRTLALLPGR